VDLERVPVGTDQLAKGAFVSGLRGGEQKTPVGVLDGLVSHGSHHV
jgi:hypothetical protein